MNIIIFLVATNKYILFVPPLVEDINKFFLVGHNKRIIVFTDYEGILEGCEKVYCERKPWPYPTLYRSNIITDYTDSHNVKSDFYYYIDADTRIVDFINEEVFGGFVVTLHCGFWRKPKNMWAEERNFLSGAYTPWNKLRGYYAGGFLGGRKFLDIQREIRKRLDKDQKYSHVPQWHDESYLNSVAADIKPDVILDPSYHYPDNERDAKSWGLTSLKPKILLLYKSPEYTIGR